MPLRPASRLPRRLARRIAPETFRLAERRFGRPKRRWLERLRTFHRHSQRSLAAWRRYILSWSIVATLALGLSTGGFFIFSPSMRLTEITIARTSPRLDIERVQQALTPLFKRHLLFLTPTDVHEPLKQAFPDLAAVDVQKQYPSHIVVTVTLKPLLAHLRIQSPDDAGEEPESLTVSSLDALTEDGIYVVAPRSEEVFQKDPLYLVDWGVRPVPQTALLAEEMLRMIEEARHLLTEQFGHNVTRTTVFLRAQEFHLQIDGTVDLWFDGRAPLDPQLLRYRTFRREVPVGDVHAYVDLRLTDRVVYK